MLGTKKTCADVIWERVEDDIDFDKRAFIKNFPNAQFSNGKSPGFIDDAGYFRDLAPLYGEGVNPIAKTIEIGGQWWIYALHLLRNGEKADYIDAEGNNFIHLTLTHEKERTRNREQQEQIQNVIKMLVEQGVDIHKENENRELPLFLAIYSGWVELMLSLGADPSRQNREEWSALHIAAKNGYSIEEFTVDNYDMDNETGDTPLHFAVALDSQTQAKTLVIRGASLDIPNHANKTPAELAGANSPCHMLRKAYLGEAVQPPEDLRSDAALAALNGQQWVSLEQLMDKNDARLIPEAIRLNSAEAVHFLERKGVVAKPEHLSLALKKGRTEAIRAMSIKPTVSDVEELVKSRNLEMLKFVQTLGVNFARLGEDEDTLLHLVVRQFAWELLPYCHELGLHPDMKNKVGESALYVNKVPCAEIFHVWPEAGDGTDWTWLHLESSKIKTRDQLDELLTDGASLTLKNSSGKDPVEAAVINGHYQFLRFIKKEEYPFEAKQLMHLLVRHYKEQKDSRYFHVLKTLQEKGATFEEIDEERRTAVFVLLDSDNATSTLEMLRQQGVDLSVTNAAGNTVLQELNKE